MTALEKRKLLYLPKIEFNESFLRAVQALCISKDISIDDRILTSPMEISHIGTTEHFMTTSFTLKFLIDSCILKIPGSDVFPNLPYIKGRWTTGQFMTTYLNQSMM